MISSLQEFELFEQLQAHSLGVNFGTFTGYENLKRTVCGDETRPADKKEIREMGNFLSNTVKEGSFGLSTNLGTAYSKSGMHEDAIKAYKQAVDLNPNYTKAHYNLGTAYIKSGMFEDAIVAFQKTISLDPEFAKAHYNLGTAYSKTGMYENAIEAYKKGIDLNPDFAAHDNLRIAYIKSGMNKYAVDAR